MSVRLWSWIAFPEIETQRHRGHRELRLSVLCASAFLFSFIGCVRHNRMDSGLTPTSRATCPGLTPESTRSRACTRSAAGRGCPRFQPFRSSCIAGVSEGTEDGFFELARVRLFFVNTIMTSWPESPRPGMRSPDRRGSSTPLRNEPLQKRQVFGVCHT